MVRTASRRIPPRETVKRALITGGSGFLGRKLKPFLHNAGFLVESCGRSEVGDILQPDHWKRILAETRPTVIFHLMGTFQAPDEVAFDSANVRPAAALFQALGDLHCNDVAVFLIGSAAEYGDVPSECQPIVETEPAQPVNAYGRSKLRVTALAQASGLRVTIVWLYNVFAADMSPRLMPGAVLAQLRHEVIKTGPLDRIRDFLHADSAMQSLARLALVECEETIVNLCSGYGWKLRDVVELLVQGKCRIVENATPAASDVFSCVGNNDLLAKLTGHRPAAPTAKDFARLITP